MTYDNPANQTRDTNNDNLIQNLVMRHERFRLGTFARRNMTVSASVLANAGFYWDNNQGALVCFYCNRRFNPETDSPETCHAPDCRWANHSVPFHAGSRAISPSEFAEIYPEDERQNHQQNTQIHTRPSHTTVVGRPNQSRPQTVSVYSNYSQVRSGPVNNNRGDLRPSSTATISPGNATTPLHRGTSEEPDNSNEVTNNSTVREATDENTLARVLTSFTSEPVAARALQGGSDIQGAVGGSTTLDLRSVSYPQFATAAARRQTYSQWSRDHPMQPDELTEAGFFYAGYADCVRCFCCGLGLKYWRATDKISHQHAKYRPTCAFNRMLHGQEFIDQVQRDFGEHPETAIRPDLETNPGRTGTTRASTNPGSTTNTTRNAGTVGTTRGSTNTSAHTGAPQAPLPPITSDPDDPINHNTARRAQMFGWSVEQVRAALTSVFDMGSRHNLSHDLLTDVLNNLYPGGPGNSLAPQPQTPVMSHTVAPTVAPIVAPTVPPIVAPIVAPPSQPLGTLRPNQLATIRGSEPARPPTVSNQDEEVTDSASARRNLGTDCTANSTAANNTADNTAAKNDRRKHRTSATVNTNSGNNATGKNSTGNNSTAKRKSSNNATANNAIATPTTRNNVTGNNVTETNIRRDNATENHATNDLRGNSSARSNSTGNTATCSNTSSGTNVTDNNRGTDGEVRPAQPDADNGAQANPPRRVLPRADPAVRRMLVQREHELLQNRTMCKICDNNPITVIFMPCGHLIACEKCAAQASHCPIEGCGKEIIATANVFLT